MSLRCAILTAVWLACVATLVGKLQVYANAPGQSLPAPEVLTLELITEENGPRRIPRVYLFLHEHCPCSRASVLELARQTELREDALITLVLSGPGLNIPGERSIRDLARQQLPDAVIHEDPTGEFARSLGALTSGHAVLYRHDGTLHFSGGLTPSRAHAGPCPGRDALETLTNSRGNPTTAPVFGCPLFSESCDDTAYCGDPNP
jgi:hypothetical protein